MRIHTSDKAIAYMTLLSGLAISAVAIYYSVAGLTAIFSAAVIPIIVMGVALEISKLAATVWLKQNWTRAPNFIRGYLLAAIAILMLITSMGIFGFLSKAHNDQNLVSGDVQSKIAIYDEKIKTAKDNIDANRKALKQMDEAVDQVMGRSTDEKGADKAVAIRRGQQKERTRLQNEIAAEQKIISQLSEERAPIAAEVRKVEAEVGPIKYIAAFVYGDTNETLLEKAVTWVIIIIVIVFDPLAVILLLASQYSFQWFRKQEEEEDKPKSINDFVPQPTELIIDEPEVAPEPTKPSIDPHPVGWMFPRYANIQEHKIADDAVEELPSDDEIEDDVPETEKKAMKAWKLDNPQNSLKHQRVLLERGVISRLPWEDYLKPQADFAAEEAKKWAIENAHTEEGRAAQEWASEKLDGVTWMEHDENGNQIKKSKDTYTQNAEQNSSTLWQRLQDTKK